MSQWRQRVTPLHRDGAITMSNNFNKISKQLIDETGGRCELCGSKRGIEVHHIIPRCCAIEGVDLDHIDNLIVVCRSCHSKLTPRSILSQYGTQRARKEGKQIGRVKSASRGVDFKEYEKTTKAKSLILKYSKDFCGTLPDAEVIKLAGCCRNSYYKYKRELKKEHITA